MNMCQAFLTAMRITTDDRVLAAMKGAAVLGDSSGYTVELKDGSQIYVGREHCKYCARTQANIIVSQRITDGRPVCDFAPSAVQL